MKRSDWGNLLKIVSVSLAPFLVAATGESSWLGAGLNSAVVLTASLGAWLSESPRKERKAAKDG